MPPASNPRPVTPSRTCQISVQSVNGPIKPVKVYYSQQPSPASLSGHQATAVTELPDSCPRVISSKCPSPNWWSHDRKYIQYSVPELNLALTISCFTYSSGDSVSSHSALHAAPKVPAYDSAISYSLNRRAIQVSESIILAPRRKYCTLSRPLLLQRRRSEPPGLSSKYHCRSVVLLWPSSSSRGAPISYSSPWSSSSLRRRPANYCPHSNRHERRGIDTNSGGRLAPLQLCRAVLLDARSSF